jgi:hypothetical protein
MDVSAVYSAALDRLFAELQRTDLSPEREAEILETTSAILARMNDGGDAA